MFGMEFGFMHLYWGDLVMIALGILFIYLAVAKDWEPLLLVPIGLGIILVNLPLGGLMDYQLQYKAPVDGIISQITPPNATVGEGDLLFTIIPDGKTGATQVTVDIIQLVGAKGLSLNNYCKLGYSMLYLEHGYTFDQTAI